MLPLDLKLRMPRLKPFTKFKSNCSTLEEIREKEAFAENC
jgi:hypothetical protein